MLLTKEKCPRCDSTNLKVVKAKKHRLKKAIRTSQTMMLPVLALRRKPVQQPDLNVCRDCGFAWDKR